ncbi:hypothetical protein WICPIJ_000309 [Wickerhamomyces pijperi]|uniref:WW domain-containing protein n=1 Tax=Wickerhamomyces pijperi TaxID=599730 RepID=A0A9P8QH50_WICPI|nr:hypothetical protein WICPIJ_000309 [Wickerhamomyces pijperi]
MSDEKEPSPTVEQNDTAAKESNEKQKLEDSWIPIFDQTHQTYYFVNALTRETQWEIPSCFQNCVSGETNDEEKVEDENKTVSPEADSKGGSDTEQAADNHEGSDDWTKVEDIEPEKQEESKTVAPQPITSSGPDASTSENTTYSQSAKKSRLQDSKLPSSYYQGYSQGGNKKLQQDQCDCSQCATSKVKAAKKSSELPKGQTQNKSNVRTNRMDSTETVNRAPSPNHPSSRQEQTYKQKKGQDRRAHKNHNGTYYPSQGPSHEHSHFQGDYQDHHFDRPSDYMREFEHFTCHCKPSPPPNHFHHHGPPHHHRRHHHNSPHPHHYHHGPPPCCHGPPDHFQHFHGYPHGPPPPPPPPPFHYGHHEHHFPPPPMYDQYQHPMVHPQGFNYYYPAYPEGPGLAPGESQYQYGYPVEAMSMMSI